MRTAVAKTIGQRKVYRPLWGSREAFYSDAGLFILGASGAYSANIIGSLPGCELVLLPMLPVLLLAKGKRAFNRQYLWFFIMTGGWLLGTLAADAYNDIGSFNRAKGTARVVFFALDFMALAILLNKKTRRIVIFAISFAAVQVIGSWQFRGNFGEQWKFGISEAIAVLALLVSSYYYSRRRYKICLLISLFLAGLNLMYGFRSQLVVHLVSAVLVLPLFDKPRNRRDVSGGRQSPMKVVFLLALAGGAVYVASAAIKFAAKSGVFDESTAAKFEGQASGDYGVLVGGRPETLVAIQAIRDSPIFGHGSFPYGAKYLQLLQDIQYEHGYSDTDTPEEVAYPVIPTHSHLTMAWVEGGILGGICWIYILALTLRAALRLSSLRPDLAPLYCYFLVGFLWDIMYSPFGSVNRLWGAYFILLSYDILRSSADEALAVRRARFQRTSRNVGLQPRTVSS
jgi:O-antigen ligase